MISYRYLRRSRSQSTCSIMARLLNRGLTLYTANRCVPRLLPKPVPHSFLTSQLSDNRSTYDTDAVSTGLERKERISLQRFYQVKSIISPRLNRFSGRSPSATKMQSSSSFSVSSIMKPFSSASSSSFFRLSSLRAWNSFLTYKNHKSQKAVKLDDVSCYIPSRGFGHAPESLQGPAGLCVELSEPLTPREQDELQDCIGIAHLCSCI